MVARSWKAKEEGGLAGRSPELTYESRSSFEDNQSKNQVSSKMDKARGAMQSDIER
jgi:hypothetical protein